MTSTPSTPETGGLPFKPTVEEQVLIGTVQSTNSLIIYAGPQTLYRLMGLFSTYALEAVSGGKVFILTKKNMQPSLKIELTRFLPARYRVTVVNGSILPHARKSDYQFAHVIVATPRTFKNDVEEGLIRIDHTRLIHIEPADLGAGSRTLRWICNQMREHRVRVIGYTRLTQRMRLERVCENLHLEEIIPHENEVTGPTRPNIQHYALPLPQEYYFLLEIVDEIRKFELEDLQHRGLPITPASPHRDVVALHDQLVKDKHDGKVAVLTGNLLRIIELQKRVVGKGFNAALAYLEDLRQRLENPNNFAGKRAINELLTDPKVEEISQFLEKHRTLQHPKLRMLLKLIQEHTGLIVVISPNPSLAAYLAEELKHEQIPTLHIPELLGQLSKVQLEQRLARFKEHPTWACVANTVNMVLAQRASLLIAYEVSASVMERLDRWEGEVARIFLISKQTTEEKRFFQLKNLGRPRNDS